MSWLRKVLSNVLHAERATGDETDAAKTGVSQPIEGTSQNADEVTTATLPKFATDVGAETSQQAPVIPAAPSSVGSNDEAASTSEISEKTTPIAPPSVTTHDETITAAPPVAPIPTATPEPETDIQLRAAPDETSVANLTSSASPSRSSVLNRIESFSRTESFEPPDEVVDLSKVQMEGIVTVEGPDGTLMTVPALPHSSSGVLRMQRKQSVTGTKIQSILSRLESEESGLRLGTAAGAHNQSLELLTERSVARKHKTVFEEGEEDGEHMAETPATTSRRRRLVRTPDGAKSPATSIGSPGASASLPPSPSPARPRTESHGFGHFRRKHHAPSPTDGESDFGSSSSIPMDSRPSISGTTTPTTLRKGRKGAQSATSLHAPERTRAVSVQSIESEMDRGLVSPPTASATTTLPRRSSRNFKEWYNGFVSSAKQAEDTVDEVEFPDYIRLDTIFGSKKRKPDGIGAMVWAALCYETCKNDPTWAQRPPSPTRRPGASPTSPETAVDEGSSSSLTDDEYSYRYRVLDIFKDGKIEGLEYVVDVESGMETITHGTADKLLDALIWPLGQDMTYAEVFLGAYRFFLTPMTVLNWLIEWYNVDVDDDCLPSHETFLRKNRRYIRARSIKVLLLWIKSYWNDFHTSPELVAELSSFVEHVSQISFGDGQKMTQAIREQKLSWYTTQYIPPFIPKRGTTDTFRPWALSWEPKDFAQQLCLIDHMLFKQIRPDSYLHLLQAPISRIGGGLSGPLKLTLEYVAWFRMLGVYTEKIILGEDGPKKRGKAIKLFIKIAKASLVLIELNNFNTAFAIAWGLRRPTIAKLNQAWESLSSKYLDTLTYLEALMDPANGYENLWKEMEESRPPGIPLLAAYMQEVLEVHEEVDLVLDPVSSRPSTLKRRRRRRAGAEDEAEAIGEEANEDEDAEGAADDDLSASKSQDNLVIDPQTEDMDKRVINFEKFYDLYNIIVEIETFRTVSYHTIHVDKDSTAMVLTHIRDHTVGEGVVDAGMPESSSVASGNGVGLASVASNGGGGGNGSANASASMVANKSDKSVKRMTSFAKLMGSSSTDVGGPQPQV
ncbi:hypothetical protein HDV00_012044 [Rhizophlyctis rosea]|nr:hypothetical protein HDV00_012044 [Rhizophlyctis rosea]